MFISVLELFKIGIGPSSSHTMGPMLAANSFINEINNYLEDNNEPEKLYLRCILKGSLAFTGKGHNTDNAIVLGLNKYTSRSLIDKDIGKLISKLCKQTSIQVNNKIKIQFIKDEDIIFDYENIPKIHPNTMEFELYDVNKNIILQKTYYSIGGGFINTKDDMINLVAPLKMEKTISCSYGFEDASSMLEMSKNYKLSIADMKRKNELEFMSEKSLNKGLDEIWYLMKASLLSGLSEDGILPGSLEVKRRAKNIHIQLENNPKDAQLHDWLSAYAMAVNEENAMGHSVVTAPTNGAAGVIPAILYYLYKHENINHEQIRDFLLTASAIGSIIKHKSSISGAEVGCQGEVGSASAMGAAGLCAIKGGSVNQIENAAEIALEHHLGLTCDPVGGLVQVPCIERNAFGALKAYLASSLALRNEGDHFMPLDSCIKAMKQTGLEMSHKLKETSLGGLAVSYTEC